MDLFEGGDVEQGKPMNNKVENLLVFEGTEIGMQEILTRVMEAVVAATES